jgi:hypothetical protein
MSLLFAQAEAGAEASAGPAAAIGWIIAGLLILGFAVAILINMRRGKAEVGAELTLARTASYLSDDELEGKKLDRTLGAGLCCSLSSRWRCPCTGSTSRPPGGRHRDAPGSRRPRPRRVRGQGQVRRLPRPRGRRWRQEDPHPQRQRQFVAEVSWQAPALNTVLYRYSKEEVLDI